MINWLTYKEERRVAVCACSTRIPWYGHVSYLNRGAAVRCLCLYSQAVWLPLNEQSLSHHALLLQLASAETLESLLLYLPALGPLVAPAPLLLPLGDTAAKAVARAFATAFCTSVAIAWLLA